MEIACDESGYEGEKLVGGVTTVFAHASVRLAEDEAAACVQELRRLIRSPATVYKANHVLRSKHRPVLLWLLGDDGPLHGQANVRLVDKTWFLVRKLVDTVLPGADAAEVSARLSGDQTFLRVANDVLRSRAEGEVEATFLAALGRTGLAESALEVRSRLKEFRARQPDVLPVLDPLWEAIIHAVEYWGGAVRIAHDRQTTLSPERVAVLKKLAHGLVEVELQDSFTHPRVQVADFLAGVARKIASDQLEGRDDPEVTALLRPYLRPLSDWYDEPSRRRLSGIS